MTSAGQTRAHGEPLTWTFRLEGIWSLLKQSMVNFAAADLDGLVRIVKRKLKKIQYRPGLIEGCLAGTGLSPGPGQTTQRTSRIKDL